MIDSVREVSQSGELLDLYVKCYEKRYRVRPILNQGFDQTTAKDLIREHGYTKASELIEAFLQSEYFTFVTQKHPLGALKKNINVVNVDLEALRRKKGNTSTKALRLRCYRICDTPNCGARDVVWEGFADDFVRPVFCEECILNPYRLQSAHTSIAHPSLGESYIQDSDDRMERLRI